MASDRLTGGGSMGSVFSFPCFVFAKFSEVARIVLKNGDRQWDGVKTVMRPGSRCVFWEFPGSGTGPG